MPVATDLLLNLRRVQYVSVPEALITALAWRVLEPTVERPRPVGLVYRLSSRSSQGRQLVYLETRPRDSKLRAFGDAMASSGLRSETGSNSLAVAVVSGLEGVRATKGGRQAAVPLTPALALMQNVAGLQGSANPPALGTLVEQMFSLGASSGQQLSAAQLWLRAARHRCAVDPVANAIDRALVDVVHESVRDVEAEPELPVSAPGLFPDSPYEWFAQSWSQLCSNEWVEALPGRVWVDWASTVLRLAVGCGALWEAAWFDGIARSIVLKSDVGHWEDLRDNMPEALPWKASGSAISVRDVAPLLKWRVHRSEQVRAVLSAWVQGNVSRMSMDAISAVKLMQADADLCDELAQALGGQTDVPGANNRWEAIRYALKIREVAGDNADYYGLLSSSGRYLFPEPGVEWVAAVGSLVCGEPGGIATVGDLQRNLEKLGLRPEVSDLIRHLERAGVARGSADADLGVEIRAAFGGMR